MGTKYVFGFENEKYTKNDKSDPLRLEPINKPNRKRKTNSNSKEPSEKKLLTIKDFK